MSFIIRYQCNTCAFELRESYLAELFSILSFLVIIVGSHYALKDTFENSIVFALLCFFLAALLELESTKINKLLIVKKEQ